MKQVRFLNQPLNEEMFTFMKNLGWEINVHPEIGESFIHNGVYDRKASSKDGEYKGKDGRYYYCVFQESRDDEGKLLWYRSRISSSKKGSSSYRNELEINLFESSNDTPPGWDLPVGAEFDVVNDDPRIRQTIDKFKRFVSQI
jgi:hypothetical protein